jgi:hypothetical protein
VTSNVSCSIIVMASVSQMVWQPRGCGGGRVMVKPWRGLSIDDQASAS